MNASMSYEGTCIIYCVSPSIFIKQCVPPEGHFNISCKAILVFRHVPPFVLMPSKQMRVMRGDNRFLMHL